MQLDNKVAVITGGASGIGKATALAMARRGTDIVLADINEVRLTETAQTISALGRQVVAVRCDVTSDRDVEQLATTALATMGRVDIVFNNAGVICRGALEAISMADWTWQFDVNVLGVVRGVKVPFCPTCWSGVAVISSTRDPLPASLRSRVREPPTSRRNLLSWVSPRHWRSTPARVALACLSSVQGASIPT